MRFIVFFVAYFFAYFILSAYAILKIFAAIATTFFCVFLKMPRRTILHHFCITVDTQAQNGWAAVITGEGDMALNGLIDKIF